MVLQYGTKKTFKLTRKTLLDADAGGFGGNHYPCM